MSQITVGTLERVDVGPGVWVLVTEDGRRLVLQGPVPAGLEGQRVAVKGRMVADAMGFGPMGDGALVPEDVQPA